jgi:peptidoglycan/LPS O-acetylase OafA/YrhL
VCAWNKTFSLGTVVSNFLFLHGIWELGIEPIIIPTWSLTYEWLFYLIFPALVLVVRRGNGLSLHHTLLCAGVALLLILPFSGDYVRFLMFFAGASLASLRPRQVQNWATKVSDWPIIILALLVNGLFVFDKNYPHFIWPFLITTSVLVAKAVYGTGLLNRIFSLAPLRSLGNISYSFYLLHGTIIMLLMDQVGPALKGLTPILGFILLISSAFCLSIVSAKFSYVVLEAPYFAWRAQSVKGEDATLVKFHKRTYQDIGFFLRRLP